MLSSPGPLGLGMIWLPTIANSGYLCYFLLASLKSSYVFVSLLCVCVCSCVLSCVRLFATPWIVACQAPLFMEVSRQEYWSGLPFPTPGDLPDPRIEPTSLVSPVLAGRFFNHCPTWEALSVKYTLEIYPTYG